MNSNEILSSISDSEFLTTEQICAVLELGIDMIQHHGKAAEDLLERIRIDDAVYQRRHGQEAAHACH